MGVRNLDAVLRPTCVAVMGPSNSVDSVGGTLWKNLATSGFAGEVFPVNLKCDCVQGAPAFASIKQVPRVVDLAVVCVPAPVVPVVVRECGEAGVRAVIIISAGFREADAAGRELEAVVQKEAARFNNLRIVGPNCLGVIVPELKLSASFAVVTRQRCVR